MLSRLEQSRREWTPEWRALASAETIEALRDEYLPELPSIERGSHLLAYLFEIGPTQSGPMGAGELEWPTIDAWCNRTGIDLQPWESRALRRLSIAYLNESHAAEKRDRQPPWRADDAKPAVTEAQSALRALANL